MSLSVLLATVENLYGFAPRATVDRSGILGDAQSGALSGSDGG